MVIFSSETCRRSEAKFSLSILMGSLRKSPSFLPGQNNPLNLPYFTKVFWINPSTISSPQWGLKQIFGMYDLQLKILQVLMYENGAVDCFLREIIKNAFHIESKVNYPKPSAKRKRRGKMHSCEGNHGKDIHILWY